MSINRSDGSCSQPHLSESLRVRASRNGRYLSDHDAYVVDIV